MTNNEITINQRAANRLAQVLALPIAQLDLRAPMLIAEMADIVAHYKTTYGIGAKFINGQSWFSDLLETAALLGFEFLGSGYFSGAFKHPQLPGRVVKVGFKKEDSGAAYAAWCKANQGLQGVPVIHHIQRHRECYTVLMDELKDFTFRDCTISQSAQYKIVSSLVSHDGHDKDAYCVDDTQRELAETCRAIQSFFKGIASFDIHSGNVMLNSKGDVVITDPVSYVNDELNAVEFEDLVQEIAANLEAKRMSRAIERGQRKHPSTTERQRQKVRAKAKRNGDKRRKRNQERRDKDFDVIMMDAECENVALLWDHTDTLPHGYKRVGDWIRRLKEKPAKPEILFDDEMLQEFARLEPMGFVPTLKRTAPLKAQFNPQMLQIPPALLRSSDELDRMQLQMVRDIEESIRVQAVTPFWRKPINWMVKPFARH